MVISKRRTCFTCQSRKVKCDGAFPHCGPCRRSKFISCGGYENRVLFQKPKKSPSAGPSSSDSASQSPTQLSIEPPNFVDLGGFSPLICRAFLVNLAAFPEFLLYVGQDEGSTSMPQRSFDALAMCYYGQYQREEKVRSAGARAYGSVLVELNIALRANDLSVPVLISAMVMLQYEGFARTSDESRFVHCDGLAQLIKARGPLRHQAPFERKLFEYARMLLCGHYMWRRQKPFFASEEWLQVPWMASFSPKNPNEELMDIITGYLRFWEDLNTVKGLPEIEKTESALNLQQRINTYWNTVDKWETIWTQNRNPSARSTPEYRTFKGVCMQFPDHLLGRPLHFWDVQHAFEYSATAFAKVEMSILSQEVDLLCGNPTLSDPVKHARSVLQTIPYFVDSPIHGLHGTVFVQWLLYRVFEVFPEGSEEVRWIAEMIDIFDKESGIGAPPSEYEKVVKRGASVVV